MRQSILERAAALAAKIEVHGDGSITLPRPEWEGWTLEQEMADFDAKHPAPVTPDNRASE